MTEFETASGVKVAQLPTGALLVGGENHIPAGAVRALREYFAQDTAPGVPSDSDLRTAYPEVEAFAEQMRKELWSNRHKGDHAGWRSMTLRQAWGEISWHVAKLAGALKAEDVAQIRELAADVANGAMMLDDILLVSGVADICRCGVGVEKASPGCAWHEQRNATRAAS